MYERPLNLPEMIEECWHLHKHSETWIEATDSVRVEIVYRTVKGDSVRVEFLAGRETMKKLRLSVMAAALRRIKQLIAAKGSEPCKQGGVTNEQRGRKGSVAAAGVGQGPEGRLSGGSRG